MSATTYRPKPVTRALAHQCPSCRRNWALRLVEHPAGAVVICRYCSAVRSSIPASTGRARVGER